LRAFAARRGLKDLGGFVECNAPLGPRWEVFTRVQLARLQHTAAASPVVRDAFQPFVVLTTARRF
jgi:outer membrane scaffolding protein for murein synthesis (MipA/OmpV family)